MAIGDRLRRLLDPPTGRALTLGTGKEFVEKLSHATQELTCDVATLQGPNACLHNDHNEILRSIDKVTDNQAVIDQHVRDVESRVQQAEERLMAELRAIKAFLDKHYEGSP